MTEAHCSEANVANFIVGREKGQTLAFAIEKGVNNRSEWDFFLFFLFPFFFLSLFFLIFFFFFLFVVSVMSGVHGLSTVLQLEHPPAFERETLMVCRCNYFLSVCL